MSSIQATLLPQGMLIEFPNDLYRIDIRTASDPGQQARSHAAKYASPRNIRTNRLTDHKFRAEDDVERARLDEQEMPFLYRDGRSSTIS